MAINNWIRQMLPLKKIYRNADQTLITELHTIINEFKIQISIKNSQNKKIDYLEKIKQEITCSILYCNFLTIIDSDYVRMVLKFVYHKDYLKLSEEDYEHFFELEYFDIMIGKST